MLRRTLGNAAAIALMAHATPSRAAPLGSVLVVRARATSRGPPTLGVAPISLTGGTVSSLPVHGGRSSDSIRRIPSTTSGTVSAALRPP